MTDDHTLFRQGVRTLLQAEPDIEVVAEAANAADAVPLAAEARPDVVLLDIGMPGLSSFEAARLIRAYGTEAETILGRAAAPADLGRDFGATLTEAEVRWLMTHEFARAAADVVWRRTKLGLRMTEEQIAALDGWMSGAAGHGAVSPAAE